MPIGFEPRRWETIKTGGGGGGKKFDEDELVMRTTSHWRFVWAKGRWMLLPNDVVDVFAASDGRRIRRLGVGTGCLRLVL